MSNKTKPDSTPTLQKLHKLLAHAGLASRREANRWLEAGRITVNGAVVEPWHEVTGKETICLDGTKLSLREKLNPPARVLLYHKPPGEFCTLAKHLDQTNVFATLPVLRQGRWVLVGRLDVNTSGLLLFTTDGDLAHKLMHPSHGFDREYAVRVLGEVSKMMIAQLQEGVMLDGRIARFSDLRYAGGTGANRWYHVVLMEGRKHEVKRLWQAVGGRVSKLKRVRFGPVVLPQNLRQGAWQEFSVREASALYRLTRLPVPPSLQSASRKNAGPPLALSQVLIPYPGLKE